MRDKALIYARLSREDEDKLDGIKTDSKSIENQIKLLTDYAVEKGFDIYKVYYDDGFSGGDFNRPGLNNVMKDLRTGKFNVFMIKDFSRLGRSTHRVGDLIENIFPRYNVRVISVDDHYDSLYYQSDEPVVLKNFLNEFYLKEFKKKMRVVRTHNANTKHLNYYPKYGYNFDEERREIIDEYSANIVKRIFHLIADGGLSTIKVADILNEEGVPTRSHYATEVLGLKPLNKNTSLSWTGEKVWEIVRDYEYCGHSLNWTRHKKEERILLKNTHLAIIDEDLYWRAQAVIDKRSKSNRRLNHLGKIIFDRKANKNLFYCRSVYPGGKDFYFLRVNGLQAYRIEATMLENIIYKDVIKFIKACNVDSERMYNIFKTRLFGKNGVNLTTLQNNLKKLNEKYMALMEQSYLGIISQETFNNESAHMREEIQEAEKTIENYSNMEADIEILKIKFKKFLGTLSKLPFDKKDLIRFVVGKIYIDKIDGKKIYITIHYKFEM